jgi:hypothetical protein
VYFSILTSFHFLAEETFFGTSGAFLAAADGAAALTSGVLVSGLLGSFFSD